ncbi:MAG TPA: ABC transporter permease, partial [Paraburkholderia sp.]
MKNSVPSPAFATGETQPRTSAARGSRPRIEFARLRDLALLPALALLIVIGAFVSPSFLTKANLISVLGASAALALVVLAESLIVLTGKFDLSLESTVGIAPA